MMSNRAVTQSAPLSMPVEGTTAKRPFPNPSFEWACEYAKRGISLVPIPFRSKKPILRDWPSLEIAVQDLYKYFDAERQNIGVILGERSGGLVDIDLDSPEAIKLADFFLPETQAIFGREGKPSSHRLYFCDGAKFSKFNNPLTVASDKQDERRSACIVEIRTSSAGKGIQTVFPPSVHESGEQITWVIDGEPTVVTFATLETAVNLLAAASLLVKSWRLGIRHDLTLAVSGTLLRHGFDLTETKQFIRAVCTVANDEEISDRLKAIEDTGKALKNDGNAFGIPKFIELTDKRIVDAFCKWLNIRKGIKSLESDEAADDERIKVVCMQDVEASEVEWLWKPFIPVGEFTILEGIEGIGKSWIGCALACAVASGANLPFHDGTPLEPGRVLLLSAEDSLSHTLRPRLDSMGANLHQIFAIDEVFSLNDPLDLRCFEAEIAKYRPKLVILDPMFSFTSGKDLNAESASRPIARKLIALAQKYDCAIIGVRHVGKSKGQGDPRNAGLGSISWRASARSVLLVGQDADTGERAICQTKNNLSEQSPLSVGFEIVDGRFLFIAKPSSLTKERMLAQAKDPDTRAEHSEAAEFLSETLRNGERPSKEVEKESKELGISVYALRKAKIGLGVESFKKGGTFGGDKQWYLRLPGPAEVVDIRAFQHLQESHSNKASYDNSLAEEIEIPENR